MRTRVVLDTNVLLDLYVFNDPRTEALKTAIESDQLDLLTCRQALAELADVLVRPKFKLTPERCHEILMQWQSSARAIADSEIQVSPWRCKDKADQIFLDLAWTFRPCTLISKDLQVLKFSKRALKEHTKIVSSYS